MEIVNKVAHSGLVTIDLESYINDIIIDEFDIREYLYMEYVLKEKDFRIMINQYDWSIHKNHYLSVWCSNDAIIAPWAYMLISSAVKHYAIDVIYGNIKQAKELIIIKKLRDVNWEDFSGKRILLKGCGMHQLPASIYMLATNYLLPYAERIMYGEACSFVPVYRRNLNS